MVFQSLQDAEAWKKENGDYLEVLENSVLEAPGVIRAEVWLCANVESRVIGYDEYDEEVIAFIISEEKSKPAFTTP